jgi:hypothetical protein
VTRIDDAGGGYTYAVSCQGQQEQIKADGRGKPLSKDAGSLTF